MKLVKNIPKAELDHIKKVVAEAFMTNELFHEFGSVEERRENVIKYMSICIDYVYESDALYAMENGEGYIGLQYSDQKLKVLTVKMLIRLLRAIPFTILKRYMRYVKQIGDGNKKYAVMPHVDVLFVCVPKEKQGKGYARELVEFAKKKALERHVPLLFDTDMKACCSINEG